MDDLSPSPGTPPGGLWIPLDGRQIEAAKTAYRENKGSQWAQALAVGLQVGGDADLRDGLVALLLELDVPTATISDMFSLSGQEVWDIAASDPVSMFFCLDCGAPLEVRDRRDLLRLRRALRAAAGGRVGDLEDVCLLCESCTEFRLRLHNEERRLGRLARGARTAQLRKLPFGVYRMQPEWQARRSATLARAGHRCQACGARDARLDVHHNTYENYGDERPRDLTVLCEECHGLFHGRMEDAS